MKKNMKNILLLAVSMLLFNCTSDNIEEASINTLPTLTTTNATSITSSKIVTGGNISSNGGLEIISRGICWDIDQEPTVDKNTLLNGSGLGEYAVEISNLESNTNYYVRAFATNSLGTSYGNELNITTLKDVTYEVLVFEFTPDTGNNSSRLKYEIKFNNLNDISINGYHTITLNIDGLISSNIASSSSPCAEISGNSSCTISFDEEESFDIGMINSIELVSVEYHIEN